MGKIYDAIDSRLQDFISKQYVFFIATAPLAGDGHVNLSQRGLDRFRVLGLRQVAYLGLGVETLAHLRENGRIVVMFCAFAGPPKIVRLHGRGRVVLPRDPGFEHLLAQFPKHVGTRSVIVIDVERISDSCGYGVPMIDPRPRRARDRSRLQVKTPRTTRRTGLRCRTAAPRAETQIWLPAMLKRW